jgi:glutathione S-transferase
VKLHIGNKSYSSWSLRPWLAMAQAGIPFEERVIPLDQPGTAADIAAVSGAGRVPVLEDGGLTVWDSLAICEYLAERLPEKRLWPGEAAARAVARSVVAEMHSGFTAIRTACPFKVRETIAFAPTPEVQADVRRLTAIWEDCRRRFGAGGPFLFGAFTIADAYYAPVVSRFRTYGLPLAGAAATWADAVWSLPAYERWRQGAAAETWSMARYGVK